MQLTDRVKNCNGCEACMLGCKYSCIKMITDDSGRKVPRVNEDGCQKCNNCILYCPVYNPVELPEFENFYEYDDSYYTRNMAPIYREAIRKDKKGEVVEFAGTLCQIAGLKSVLGDKLGHNIRLLPLHCDRDNPKRPECEACPFYK